MSIQHQKEMRTKAKKIHLTEKIMITKVTLLGCFSRSNTGKVEFDMPHVSWNLSFDFGSETFSALNSQTHPTHIRIAL